jgi:hypothetical protein
MPDLLDLRCRFDPAYALPKNAAGKILKRGVLGLE